jgi:cell wall-associated NlpC family hydrolase
MSIVHPNYNAKISVNPNQIKHLDREARNLRKKTHYNHWLMKLRHIFIVFCMVSAHAAPSSTSSDDLEIYLSDNGFINKISKVSQNVGNKASDLVLNAMGFLGVPYRRGGSDDNGFDCSGFVRSMYEQTLGKALPRSAREQAEATEKIDKKDLQPGDLVFFNTMRQTFSHVGIYVGDNKFIHSPRPGKQVKVEDMRQSYWLSRFTGARRVDNSSNSDGSKN